MIVLEQLVFRWGVKPENIMLVIPRDVKLYEKENRANYGMTNDSRLEYIEKLTENHWVKNFITTNFSKSVLSFFKSISNIIIIVGV